MGTITTSTAVCKGVMRAITREADHSGPAYQPNSADAKRMIASDTTVSRPFGDLTMRIYYWMGVV